MKKRFFAIFLAVCLVATLLPAGVLAADGTQTIHVGGVELSKYRWRNGLRHDGRHNRRGHYRRRELDQLQHQMGRHDADAQRRDDKRKFWKWHRLP